MEESRPRKTQKDINKGFILSSEKVLWRELLVNFFPLLVWIYCIVTVFFFIDSLFSINNEYISLLKIIFKMNSKEIKAFLNLSFIMFITIYIVLGTWSVYNKKRYGKLKRRNYPKPATKQDFIDLNIIDEKTFEMLQKESIIEFDKNPIVNPGD